MARIVHNLIDLIGHTALLELTAVFTSPEQVERLIDGNTCALFFEIITNPQLFILLSPSSACSTMSKGKTWVYMTRRFVSVWGWKTRRIS